MNACTKGWSWAATSQSLLTKSSELSCPFPSPLFLTHSLIDHANEWQECSVEIFRGKVKTSQRFVFFPPLLSLYFIAAATISPCFFLSFSATFSLHLPINTRKKKSQQKKNHILIRHYHLISCNLSRCISFSVVTEMSAQVIIRAFEPKTDQICHRKQLVKWGAVLKL